MGPAGWLVPGYVMDRTGQDRTDTIFLIDFTTVTSFFLFNLKKKMSLMGGY